MQGSSLKFSRTQGIPPLDSICHSESRVRHLQYFQLDVNTVVTPNLMPSHRHHNHGQLLQYERAVIDQRILLQVSHAGGVG